jgi:hypothetical protein
VILGGIPACIAGRAAPTSSWPGGAGHEQYLPAGSTSNFDFTARGGGGIQVFPNGHAFTEIGCRWADISNANLGERNPEFNGVQVNIAFHWIRSRKPLPMRLCSS